MKNAAPLVMILWLLIGLFAFPAVAQDLIIVRSRQEFISRGLEPALKEKISRGRLMFRFGVPGTNRSAYDPYQMVIVYPQSYSNRRESTFTGKDASGTLYFHGYPVAPSGWISIKVEPSDAEVLVDGHAVKVDGNSGLVAKVGHPLGQHTVEARKPGFQPYVGEVEIRQASEVHLDIKLAK